MKNALSILLIVLAHGLAGADLEEIVVRADASVLQKQRIGSASSIDEEALALVRANHPSEVLVRVPGVWVARGSGQEHLTAMRSGVLTGAGACGEFLLLENGIPIRPAGFCNVNNLFEINTEQASRIEVVRGPASALFGGNALHGVINVVTLDDREGARTSIEAGPYDYVQVRASASTDVWGAALHSTHSNGYRDATGFGQQKLNADFTFGFGNWQVTNAMSAGLLNQETGGYVRGFRAYADPMLERSNPTPEAYRDAWSLRASSAWRLARDEGDILVTPYARRSSMTFLQHFLPGQPLEHNDQTSFGVLARYGGRSDTLRWTAGGHVEAMYGALSEIQDGPTTGSPFLVATRPPGTHYDYEVDSLMTAAFYDLAWDLAQDVEVVHSLRVERLAFEYDNRHLDGNTRDDGTPCGFGGCLYTRPADRDDNFTDVAGRLGVAWDASTTTRLYAVAGIGFRPPQATELYRLQSGQTIAEIDSEELRSFEIGIKAAQARWDADLAVYTERTENLIFRDADGFNVSDGETKSAGVEFAIGLQVAPGQTLSLAGTYARHEYAFTRDAAAGETIIDGNEVDSAPRWLGSAQWRAQIGAGLVSELEVAHVGSHFVNAANTAEYPGHWLVNWRGAYDIGSGLKVWARVLNVTDRDFADRADFAFGSYRYFPGMPRQVYAGVEFALD